MTLLQAAIIFATSLMDHTNGGLQYDKQTVAEVVTSITEVTQDPQEVEILIRIARWESGGFRKSVASCKVKGDNGQAHGLFQVHPRSKQEALEACGTYKEQATLALARVRESVAMCGKQGKKRSDLLTGYTVGHCVNGDRSAGLRWGDGSAIKKIIEKDNERLAATDSSN